jgi:predicted nucleic acid-binding protein
VTPLLAVFDASLLLRAALDRSAEARAWTLRAEEREIVALVPELIWAELTNVLAHQVRVAVLDADDAAEVLGRLLRLPLETYAAQPAASGAFAAAVSRGLSGYDAFYLVLADAADAVLVTADRKLAEAAVRAELIA